MDMSIDMDMDIGICESHPSTLDMNMGLPWTWTLDLYSIFFLPPSASACLAMNWPSEVTRLYEVA